MTKRLTRAAASACLTRAAASAAWVPKCLTRAAASAVGASGSSESKSLVVSRDIVGAAEVFVGTKVFVERIAPIVRDHFSRLRRLNIYALATDSFKLQFTSRGCAG